MDPKVDKYCIKNILFCKAIPNYTPPADTAYPYYKTYPCIDCGDRFILESSLKTHVDRKSVLITYTCRICNTINVFYNRCTFLAHVRSHVFKTATINVNDLIVEPLPVSFIKTNVTTKNIETQNSGAKNQNSVKPLVEVCYECKEKGEYNGKLHKERAKHFTKCTNGRESLKCPICCFVTVSSCAMRTHFRFHLKRPPYYCPECGLTINKSIYKTIHYPFNHNCPGFIMMKEATRLKCSIERCNLYHPSEHNDHMEKKHLKKVFKCPICVVACFNLTSMNKHLKEHENNQKPLTFYQCELCPGRLVLENQTQYHIRAHINPTVYPCKLCGNIFRKVLSLVNHFKIEHDDQLKDVNDVLAAILEESEEMYQVLKRCEKCKNNFIYRCKYKDINNLPKECPNKCNTTDTNSQTEVRNIICFICKNTIPEEWNKIKEHFALIHQRHNFVDCKINLQRLDVSKYNNKQIKKRRRFKPLIRRISQKKVKEGISAPSEQQIHLNPLICNKCGLECQNKESLNEHTIVKHKDPFMAYQCMECGQCFAVKPSFSTHLLLEHNITDFDEYIQSKQCYNADALKKQNFNQELVGPVKENQCNICLDQFNESEELEKHYRVHGMAFLLKNTSKNSP